MYTQVVAFTELELCKCLFQDNRQRETFLYSHAKKAPENFYASINIFVCRDCNIAPLSLYKTRCEVLGYKHPSVQGPQVALRVG